MTARRGDRMAIATLVGLTLALAMLLPGVLPPRRTASARGYLAASPDTVVAGLFRLGRELLGRGDSASLAGAIGHFEEALDLDPTYAEAYAGRAAAYVALGCGGYLPPDDAFPKARAAALTALQLDSTLAEPHASLSDYDRYYERDEPHPAPELGRALSRMAGSPAARAS
ncbi:MAG TPA: tetratricopeptide repeat protein, partial [Gemmatimonadales bacterium]|nr:tetratricopeptide repeat protein [Gemmatimonadales bacterium]